MQSTNLLYNSDYTPFGANFQKDGQSYFQFSGKPIDGSTGLYYFGARYYNPALQRFITEDTFPGITEDPQSLNRYAYVENNPLSRTDPTGNCDVVYACSPSTTTTSSSGGGSTSSSSSSSSSGTSGLPIYYGGGTTGYAQWTGGGEPSPAPTGGSSASPNDAGQASPSISTDTSTSAKPAKLWTPMQTDFLSPGGGTPGEMGCSLRPAICPGEEIGPAIIQLSFGEFGAGLLGVGFLAAGGGLMVAAAPVAAGVVALTGGLAAPIAPGLAGGIFVTGAGLVSRGVVVFDYVKNAGQAATLQEAWKKAWSLVIPPMG